MFAKISLLLFLTTTTFLRAQDQVAKVIILRGQVKSKNKSGKILDLKKGDWVNEGSVIQTAKKSFAKLLFKDKSKMSLGPDSKMLVNKFPKGKAGLITLVKGQLRSKVTKDPLKKSQSKLYIRTKSAAMGIRGTDFQTIYNEQNSKTSVITFEGEVAMVQTQESGPSISYSNLENKLNSPEAVSVREGTFSGTQQNGKANLPVKVSPAQLDSMKKNENFDSTNNQNTSQQATKTFKNVVPPGMNTKDFSNNSSIIENSTEVLAINEIEQLKKEIQPQEENRPPPEGFYDKSTGDIAPPAGGFVDLKTGLYIPPPPGSTFDANTGVYVPPPNMGSFDARSGEYIPPKGFELSSSGQFVESQSRPKVESSQDSAKAQVRPAPVLISDPNTFGSENFSTSLDFNEVNSSEALLAVDPINNFDSQQQDELIDDLTDEIDDQINEPDNIIGGSTPVNITITEGI